MSPKFLYLGNPGDLGDGVGNIFARKMMQITNLETVFESEQIWNLKLLIFSQQLMSPKFLYLGNPGDLGDGVGNIFARKMMRITNLETVFKSDKIWNF